MIQKGREKAFWTYDKVLRGGRISDHLDEITSILESDFDSSKPAIEGYISEILAHASNTTVFYSDLKGTTKLQNFPVIDKNIIRDNYGKFISSSFREEDLKPVVTSGSTGTPFRVLQNKEKVLRNTADTLYFSKKAGYEIGQRLYYLKIWNEINKKSRLSSFVQNVIPVDVMDQSPAFFKKFVRELGRDKTAKSFLGYASAFESLCKFLDQAGIEKVTTEVHAIISMAEALNDYTKQRMTKYFDCEAVSRYSNTENGILAQQRIGNDSNFYLNRASYVIEILEIDSEAAADVGVPGRIVITDLFNYGMPMIRYDTGDIGVIDYTEKGEPVLSGIEGRKMDMIYDTKGELVSSFVITNNMWKYTDIKQYQFLQESADSYCFKINPAGEFNREEELVEEFEEYFGDNAKIRVEYVSEIPLLSSGKRKKVINKMN